MNKNINNFLAFWLQMNKRQEKDKNIKLFLGKTK